MLVATYCLPLKVLFYRYAVPSAPLYVIALAIVDMCSLLKQSPRDTMVVHLAYKVVRFFSVNTPLFS